MDPRALPLLLLLALLGTSCQANPAAPPAEEPRSCEGDLPAGGEEGDWTQFGRDGTRRGVDPTSPRLGRVVRAWAVHLDGALLAQPLVAGGLVVQATENDSVYAFDAATGCQAWRAHLGDPVAGSELQCGNLAAVGITSTPVIDRVRGVVHVLAYLKPAHHELVTLALATGAVLSRRPADPPGSDPLLQLARPALAMANGRVYAGFGGRAGDCGEYHGYLAGYPTEEGEVVYFRVPSSRGGGVWAQPGATLLPNGDLLVATGNGESAEAFDGGNQVVRLSPTLNATDFFAPVNWAALNRADLDLGSTGPTLLEDGLAFQVGKGGQGYLLDIEGLGGIGGDVFSAPLGGCYAIGGTAFSAPRLFLPCDHGLKALKLSGRSFGVAWAGPRFRAGTPIVAGEAVWSIDFEGGRLDALDLETGGILLELPIGIAEHFVAPSAARGRMFVPAGRNLVAFTGI